MSYHLSWQSNCKHLLQMDRDLYGRPVPPRKGKGKIKNPQNSDTLNKKYDIYIKMFKWFSQNCDLQFHVFDLVSSSFNILSHNMPLPLSWWKSWLTSADSRLTVEGHLGYISWPMCCLHPASLSFAFAPSTPPTNTRHTSMHYCHGQHCWFVLTLVLINYFKWISCMYSLLNTLFGPDCDNSQNYINFIYK